MAMHRETVLLAAEGFARFAALLPLFRVGGWTKTGFGILTAACLFWCGFGVWVQKKLRQEGESFFAALSSRSSGVCLTVCLAFVSFFTAQASVFLYLALWMVRRIWEMAGGGTAAWDAFLLLPALTLVVVNSGFCLRGFCVRAWQEVTVLWGTYRAAGGTSEDTGKEAQRVKRVIGQSFGGEDLLWWAAALAAAAMAAGYRDEYCAAGFYLAYNWQLLASFAALLCVFFTVRKNCGKRDCRD